MPYHASSTHSHRHLLCTPQIPEDGEDEDFTPEEMEALENDMQDDFEVAEMIK